MFSGLESQELRCVIRLQKKITVLISASREYWSNIRRRERSVFLYRSFNDLICNVSFDIDHRWCRRYFYEKLEVQRRKKSCFRNYDLPKTLWCKSACAIIERNGSNWIKILYTVTAFSVSQLITVALSSFIGCRLLPRLWRSVSPEVTAHLIKLRAGGKVHCHKNFWRLFAGVLWPSQSGPRGFINTKRVASGLVFLSRNERPN